MMAKKFPKQLKKAWIQYSDLYDRYMRILRRLGEGDVNGIYADYEEQIAYAVNDWVSPEERWEAGGMDDLELDLDD
jgi:hypothetical protein